MLSRRSSVSGESYLRNPTVQRLALGKLDFAFEQNFHKGHGKKGHGTVGHISNKCCFLQ